MECVKVRFYMYNPQFVDGEAQIHVVGNNPNLAEPTYAKYISDFWNEENENHYMKTNATKTGKNTVKDSKGLEITLFDKDAYTPVTIPGSVGDSVELVGINTWYRHRNSVSGLYDVDERRFRTDVVTVVGAGPHHAEIISPRSGCYSSTFPILGTATDTEASDFSKWVLNYSLKGDDTWIINSSTSWCINETLGFLDPSGLN
jgi:hypothetical protein